MIYDNPNAQMVLNFQEGVLDAIRGTEFALVIHPVDRHDPGLFTQVRKFIEQQRFYGVLVLPPLSENDAFFELLDELGCNYVRMGSAELDDPAHLVQSNDRQAVRDAVEYLVTQGHRRIGLVEGPEGFRSAHERREGWRDAVTAHGLPAGQDLVARGNYTFETGKAAGAQLLDQPQPPSAIFASNDVMAAGVVHVARERGLEVPGDLSVVGFDDTAIAATIWPPLTTVRWPIRTMARSAARKLIFGIPTVAERMLKHVSLKLRASTEYRVLLGIPNAFCRVYSLLRMLARPDPGQLITIENMPTHEQIGLMTNTSRETVTRALQVLYEQGIMEKDGRRSIVRDPARLLELIREHQ